MADISTRTEGMVGASANYYQESEIFKAIQNAQALEYDRIESNNKDLALQLSPLTATWGLVYWEEALGLPVIDNTEYDARRPVVLARLAKSENFCSIMIQSYAQAYGSMCTVTVDVQSSTVTVAFFDALPTLFSQFQKTIEKVIHAHLGIEYSVKLERRINTFVGIALQGGTKTQMNVVEIDEEQYTLITDDAGTIFSDDKGRILIL